MLVYPWVSPFHTYLIQIAYIHHGIVPKSRKTVVQHNISRCQRIVFGPIGTPMGTFRSFVPRISTKLPSRNAKNWSILDWYQRQFVEVYWRCTGKVKRISTWPIEVRRRRSRRTMFMARLHRGKSKWSPNSNAPITVKRLSSPNKQRRFTFKRGQIRFYL